MKQTTLALLAIILLSSCSDEPEVQSLINVTTFFSDGDDHYHTGQGQYALSYFYKTDKNNTVLWKHEIESAYSSNRLIQLADRSLILFRINNGPTKTVVKVAPNGNLMWVKEFDYNIYDVFEHQAELWLVGSDTEKLGMLIINPLDGTIITKVSIDNPSPKKFTHGVFGYRDGAVYVAANVEFLYLMTLKFNQDGEIWRNSNNEELNPTLLTIDLFFDADGFSLLSSLSNDIVHFDADGNYKNQTPVLFEENHVSYFSLSINRPGIGREIISSFYNSNGYGFFWITLDENYSITRGKSVPIPSSGVFPIHYKETTDGFLVSISSNNLHTSNPEELRYLLKNDGTIELVSTSIN